MPVAQIFARRREKKYSAKEVGGLEAEKVKGEKVKGENVQEKIQGEGEVTDVDQLFIDNKEEDEPQDHPAGDLASDPTEKRLRDFARDLAASGGVSLTEILGRLRTAFFHGEENSTPRNHPEPKKNYMSFFCESCNDRWEPMEDGSGMLRGSSEVIQLGQHNKAFVYSDGSMKILCYAPDCPNTAQYFEPTVLKEDPEEHRNSDVDDETENRESGGDFIRLLSEELYFICSACGHAKCSALYKWEADRQEAVEMLQCQVDWEESEESSSVAEGGNASTNDDRANAGAEEVVSEEIAGEEVMELKKASVEDSGVL